MPIAVLASGIAVICPWHGASFDLKTGAGVKRYLVTVKGNDILVSLP